MLPGWKEGLSKESETSSANQLQTRAKSIHGCSVYSLVCLEDGCSPPPLISLF